MCAYKSFTVMCAYISEILVPILVMAIFGWEDTLDISKQTKTYIILSLALMSATHSGRVLHDSFEQQPVPDLAASKTNVIKEAQKIALHAQSYYMLLGHAMLSMFCMGIEDPQTKCTALIVTMICLAHKHFFAKQVMQYVTTSEGFIRTHCNSTTECVAKLSDLASWALKANDSDPIQRQQDLTQILAKRGSPDECDHIMSAVQYRTEYRKLHKELTAHIEEVKKLMITHSDAICSLETAEKKHAKTLHRSLLSLLILAAAIILYPEHLAGFKGVATCK